MSDTFDYMATDTDKNVLKNLSKMGEHLKELRKKMIETEAAYEQAKKEHDYYASSVLPMEMFNAGLTSVELATGGIIRYERKFYCQPNKNAEDKKIIAGWLRENGGAYLVKEAASVDGSQIDKLRQAGVPFTEIDDINTNSLKAFIKDKIGANGGTAQIQIQDIPPCVHFQEFGNVDIEI